MLLVNVIFLLLFNASLILGFREPKEESLFHEVFEYDENTDYIITSNKTTWAQALASCTHIFKGTLATAENRDLKDFITSVMAESSLPLDALWVGLKNVDGVFRWMSNNETVPDSEFRCHNEEVQSDDNNCGAIIRTYHKRFCLVKLSCEATRGYICKKSTPHSTHPGWIQVGSRMYKIFSKFLTYDEAAKACFDLREDARLAVVPSSEEAKILSRELLVGRPSLENAWIGARWKSDMAQYSFEYESILLPNVTACHGYPPWIYCSIQEGLGCVLLDRHKKGITRFVESRCNRPRGYICYKSVSKPPLDICDVGDYDWRIYYNETTWRTAYEVCTAGHRTGRLPIIERKDLLHFAYLMESARLDLSHVWLGSKFRCNRWKWTYSRKIIPTEQEDGYPPWVVNGTYDEQIEKNNLCLNADRENAITIMFYGTICSYPQPFICQYDKDTICEQNRIKCGNRQYINTCARLVTKKKQVSFFEGRLVPVFTTSSQYSQLINSSAPVNDNFRGQNITSTRIVSLGNITKTSVDIIRNQEDIFSTSPASSNYDGRNISTVPYSVPPESREITKFIDTYFSTASNKDMDIDIEDNEFDSFVSRPSKTTTDASDENDVVFKLPIYVISVPKDMNYKIYPNRDSSKSMKHLTSPHILHPSSRTETAANPKETSLSLTIDENTSLAVSTQNNLEKHFSDNLQHKNNKLLDETIPVRSNASMPYSDGTSSKMQNTKTVTPLSSSTNNLSGINNSSILWSDYVTFKADNVTQSSIVKSSAVDYSSGTVTKNVSVIHDCTTSWSSTALGENRETEQNITEIETQGTKLSVTQSNTENAVQNIPKTSHTVKLLSNVTFNKVEKSTQNLFSKATPGTITQFSGIQLKNESTSPISPGMHDSTTPWTDDAFASDSNEQNIHSSTTQGFSIQSSKIQLKNESTIGTSSEMRQSTTLWANFTVDSKEGRFINVTQDTAGKSPTTVSQGNSVTLSSSPSFTNKNSSSPLSADTNLTISRTIVKSTITTSVSTISEEQSTPRKPKMKFDASTLVHDALKLWFDIIANSFNTRRDTIPNRQHLHNASVQFSSGNVLSHTSSSFEDNITAVVARPTMVRRKSKEHGIVLRNNFKPSIDDVFVGNIYNARNNPVNVVSPKKNLQINLFYNTSNSILENISPAYPEILHKNTIQNTSLVLEKPVTSKRNNCSNANSKIPINILVNVSEPGKATISDGIHLAVRNVSKESGNLAAPLDKDSNKEGSPSFPKIEITSSPETQRIIQQTIVTLPSTDLRKATKRHKTIVKEKKSSKKDLLHFTKIKLTLTSSTVTQSVRRQTTTTVPSSSSSLDMRKPTKRHFIVSGKNRRIPQVGSNKKKLAVNKSKYKSPILPASKNQKNKKQQFIKVYIASQPIPVQRVKSKNLKRKPAGKYSGKIIRLRTKDGMLKKITTKKKGVPRITTELPSLYKNKKVHILKKITTKKKGYPRITTELPRLRKNKKVHIVAASTVPKRKVSTTSSAGSSSMRQNLFIFYTGREIRKENVTENY